MKNLLPILSFPIIAFGAANDPQISQRNSADTGTVTRVLTIPSSGQDGIISFNGPSIIPQIWTFSNGIVRNSNNLKIDFTGLALSDINLTVPYSDVTGTPSLATVATSGSYTDLINKPDLGTAAFEDTSVFQPHSTALDELAALGTLAPDEAIRTNSSGDYVAETPSNFLSWLGGVSSSGSYSNPSWLTALAWSKVTGRPTTLAGYGITDAYPLSGNPSGFLTSVPAQSFTSLTGKPTTLSGYGITDAYPLSGNPSNFLTGITSGQITTALGYTPYNSTNPNNYITTAGARAAISLTTTGSGAASYSSANGTLNVPTPAGYAISPPVAGNALTSGTAFQPRSGGPCQIVVNTNVSGLVGVGGTAVIATSPTSGGTYTTVSTDGVSITILGLGDRASTLIPVPTGYWAKVTYTPSGLATLTGTYTRWDVN